MCMIKSPFLGPARANFTGQNSDQCNVVLAQTVPSSPLYRASPSTGSATTLCVAPISSIATVSRGAQIISGKGPNT